MVGFNVSDSCWSASIINHHIFAEWFTSIEDCPVTLDEEPASPSHTSFYLASLKLRSFTALFISFCFHESLFSLMGHLLLIDE